MSEVAAPVQVPELQLLTDALLSATGASRTTVRLAVGDAPPTTLVAESLAAGVRSMRDGPQPAITAAPTYVHLQQHRQILVQSDCVNDGPAPPASLIEYYGVRAQMLAPVLDGERLVGTISVHHQATTRDWTATDISALAQTQGAVSDWYQRHAAHDGGGSRVTNLHEQIAALAEIDSDHPGEGLTREVYTAEYSRAVAFVSDLMCAAGLEVREDAVGNLFGRWVGSDPSLPVVLTGSHFDTTLNAGRYDGVLGVLGAIEAIRGLRSQGFIPRRGIEVVGFAGEEPRFGAGCIGSRAMIGALTREDLDRMRDRNGVSVAQAMTGVGLDPDRLPEARISPGTYAYQLELHIEQGAVLEAEGLPIGVVEHIAAPHDLRVTFMGMPRHAGSTPMSLRRDALTGAGEVVLAVERLARESVSPTTVGTVGVLTIEPGAVNVIPGEVTMLIDIRDSDLAARTAVIAELLETIDQIAARRDLEVFVETITHDLPATCDTRIVAAVRASAEELDVPYRPITSGAYHDSMVLGSEIPIGMIFVPSRGGISHHPDEYTAPEELDAGVRVLAGALRRLASARSHDAT